MFADIGSVASSSSRNVSPLSPRHREIKASSSPPINFGPKSPRRQGDVIGSLRCAREKAEDAVEQIVSEDYYGKKSKKALRELLSSKLATTCSLFGLWDLDGSGTISRLEFREAVAALGTDATAEACDELFDEFDSDGSGEIDYAEYVRFVLRDGLKRSAHRVMDFFRRMDRNGDNEIDKYEFRNAIEALGWEIHDPYLLDEVFDTMDADGNGSLSFDEIHKQLRQGVGMHKDIGSFLAAGAAGRIELAAVNRVALRGNLEEQFLMHCKPPKRSSPAALRDESEGGSPLSLPALSPHVSPRSTRPHENAKFDILHDRASPRPRDQDFVVHNWMDGRAKRTIQEEKLEAATDRLVNTKKFYRSRTSFKPVACAPWEQPLPSVTADGHAAWTHVADSPTTRRPEPPLNRPKFDPSPSRTRTVLKH